MSNIPFSPLVRWAAVGWLAFWVPVYWHYWGWHNFLYFCDVSVILTCIGLWKSSPLLLSSQAVGAIVLNFLWTMDAVWRLAFGNHLIGGTEYMWESQYQPWLRSISLFHVAWPLLLVWAVRRSGYDARGFKLQCAIAAGVFVVSRIVSAHAEPAKNLNFALTDPLFHREWGPAPAHLALLLAVLIGVIYWPTHVVLLRTMPRAKP